VKRILFVVSEDWYFVSHRLHLAESAMRAGYEVGVLTNVSRFRNHIENSGVKLIDWNLQRRSANPVTELRAIGRMLAAIRRFKPQVLHAVALKPTLYTALAASVLGVSRRVFALGGLGFAFASQRTSARLMRPLLLFALRHALSGQGTRLILQNSEDADLLLEAGVISRERLRLIGGAGVDTTRFDARVEQTHAVPLVMLPARMLWDKGVRDFVSCATELRRRGLQARFALVGERDEQNPECVPEWQLSQWVDSGTVEWWGRREDMPAALAEASLICFPSYHEGLPKALLEAASCERAIVAYDIAGCREAVEDGVTGILVPLRDETALAAAVASLLADPERRRSMGKSGRELVVRKFTAERIAAETLSVWDEVMG
jgi:glycosyltransferase involved in cell wall biosynthesis